MSKNKARHVKVKLLAVALVVVCVGVIAFLLIDNRQHPRVTTLSPVIHQITTQSTSSNTTSKSPSTSNGISQGTSTNNSNPSSTPVNTSESQWTTSQSGVITVKEPYNDQTISSGFTLTGTSTVNNVQYTLIDNDVGVISQGALNVVNGNFSAAINYQAYATSGRLDVYSTEPNGRQINEVEIMVNF